MGNDIVTVQQLNYHRDIEECWKQVFMHESLFKKKSKRNVCLDWFTSL